MGSLYLGIDIGTTSAKCAAVDDKGAIIAFGQYPYPMSHPREGWAEQDPEDYWRGLIASVRQCLDECGKAGRSGSEVKSIALSTQGGTLILTDEAGTPIAPAMSWMDARAEKQFDDLVSETGAEFWHGTTGSRLTPRSPACKIRWLAENDPELRARARKLAFVPEFLAIRLCGEYVTDIPSASWTPLFSSFERRWSDEAVELLDVPEGSLARTVESGTVIGELLPQAASELGLPASTKMVAGAFDQAAAAHGAGASAGGCCVLSCGTAWVLYSVSGRPSIDERMPIPVCCHVNPQEWGMVQPFSGGSTYDWLHRTFGQDAATGETSTQPPVFIPHLYGGLSPDWREASRGSLVGLTMAHTQKDIESALMHGLAFESRRNVDAAEKLSVPIPSVRMVGGAGKSETWPQIIANVLGRPVEISDCVESACYGAAKLAAGQAAAGWDDRQTVREISPDPEQVEIEDRQYSRYLRFLDVLTGLYQAEW